MSYAGNTSLAAAVQERVVSTFEQALALFHQGRIDEATSGCTLIRQMDPMFEPAKQLLEKIGNPALHPQFDGGAFDASETMQLAREAMAARDFERVIQLTTEVLTNDLLNEDARILGDEAREMVEAAPFVRQFVAAAEQQLAAGNAAAAGAELEKARALDPTHPDILRLDAAISGVPPGGSDAPAGFGGFDAGASFGGTGSFGDAGGSFNASSFVVEEPSPGGRGTAQASDFGFTFEEAVPPTSATPEFSFDPPAATPAEPSYGSFSFDPAPAADQMVDQKMTFSGAFKTPVTGEFDFASAVSAPSDDDQKQIQQHLAEGDRAFEQGQIQQAIDAWSRIFLIDVTNEQASERIERAKNRKNDVERRVDELLASGIQAFEHRDRERARADFAEALRLDPDNATARDYADRIAAFEVAPGAMPPPPPPPAAAAAGKIGLDFFEEEGLPPGGEAPLMPPEPAAPKPAGAKAAQKAAPKAQKKLPVAAIGGLVVILVLAAAGWFAWSKFSGGGDADPAATKAIFARANALARGGRFDQAIAALQEVKPGDGMHDEALVMIADLQQKKAASSKMIGGRPAPLYYEEKIAAARAAFDAHDYAEAKRNFEEAMRVKPLPTDIRANYELAAQQVAKLDAAKALFAERKYADAIANLQPLLQADPENKNIRRIISDAHFNLGAIALQEDRLDDAIKEFDEVLAADPNDEFAKRSRELAVRYEGQPKDLLFRIYVKYLPLRQAG